MNVKEVEEVVVDCLKSQVFPTVLRKEGRKVILLADSGTVLVQPALDGSYSNVSWCCTFLYTVAPSYHAHYEHEIRNYDFMKFYL